MFGTLNEKEEFNKTLRVGFVRYPPAVFNSCEHFPEFGNHKKCSFPGYCIEVIKNILILKYFFILKMLKLIAKQINMAIEPIIIGSEIKEIDVGTLHEDGQWSGVLGSIANRTIDTACIFYQKTENRQPHFDFSVPIYTTHSRIAVLNENEKPLSELWRLFKPYTFDTWILIIIMLLLYMIIFAIIERIEVYLDLKELWNYPLLFWKLLRMQLLQPEVMRFQSISGKFLLVMFGFFNCLIITSIYQFWIVSSLVQSKPISPIKDGEQLFKEFKEGKYKLVSQYKGHWFYEQLKHSKTFPFKEMREIADKHKISWAYSINDALRLVQKGDHVLLLQGDDPAYFKAAHFCDIIFVDKEMPSKTSHFIFSKGNILKDKFNEAISDEIVPLRRIYERYKTLREMIRNQECDERFAKNRLYQPLSIIPFLGALLVLFTFIIFSLLVFLVEIFFYKR